MWVLSQSLDHLPLKKLYFTLLLTLFSGLVLMQVLGTQILHIQQENAKWIELAQKQSVLSQRMVKLALLTERDKGAIENIVHRLSLLNDEWSQVHFNLKFKSSHGKMNSSSSEKIEELILRIQPHKDGISDAVNELLMVAHVSELRPEAIHKIRSHEGSFLLLMEELVQVYQLEAEKTITLLSNIKFCLLFILFSSLLLLLGLSYKIKFTYREAVASLEPTDKKDFFNEVIADEFILSQASAKQQERRKEDESLGTGFRKQSIQEDALAKPTQKIKVLMIADESLPSDYIAWFLNKWEIDFSIVKNKKLAQKESVSQSFDMVLMSQQQALAHEKNYFSVEKAKANKIPIVTLDEMDIREIQAQIYGEEPAAQNLKNAVPGALYRKIREQLSKETWGI